MAIKNTLKLFALTSLLLMMACGKHVYYRVQPGDTLYAIGWQYGVDYQQLSQWNDIAEPYTIAAGQWIRVAPPVAGVAQKKPRTDKTQAAKKAVKKPVLSSTQSIYPHKTVRWIWPTSGNIKHGYNAKIPGREGLDIIGKRGQAVNAAANGRVVYSGSGLIRYGKLIIVKHNDIYLSAYAHNDTLLVKSGDEVRQGMKIAKMGNSGSKNVKLHFEIRKNGKPVNPVHYLPKR